MLIKPSASLQSAVYRLQSSVSCLSPCAVSSVYTVTQSVRQSVCSCLFRLEISSISVWKLFKSTTCNFLPNFGLSWGLSSCLSVCLTVSSLSVCRFEFCAEIKKLIPNKNKEYYIGLKFENWSSLLPDSECSTSFRLTRFPPVWILHTLLSCR